MANDKTMFESPYKSSTPPTHCCCGNGAGVTVNVGQEQVAPLFNENGQIMSRTEQAARIIAAANAKGFPTFQGS